MKNLKTTTLSILLLLTSVCIAQKEAQLNLDTASFDIVFNKLNLDKDNIVISIGESHSTKGTYKTQLYILDKLFKRGYNTLFRERGVSDANILNMYMTTGDTSLLDFTLERERTGAKKKFMTSIYKMNVINKYGVKFKGFDFERPRALGFFFSRWLSGVRINKLDYDSLSNYYFKIADTKVSCFEDYMKLIEGTDSILKKVKKSLLDNNEQYKKILGDNYRLFESIIYNPVEPDFRLRDVNMKKVILKNELDEGIKKSIIIAGSDHISSKKGLVPLLADNLSEKYKFICILFIYKNCENPYKDQPHTDPKSELRKYSSYKETDTPLVQCFIPENKIKTKQKKELTTIVVELFNQK